MSSKTSARQAKPAGKQPIDRDVRRSELIDAARDLFAAKGYHATTVDDITRAAGVAKGTFYLYFNEKREVFYEVISGFMQLIKDIGSSVSDESANPLDFFTRAETASHELMAIFNDNRKLARLAYRESMGLDSRLEDMLRDFYREIAELEARNIQRAMELGIIRKVDPMMVAYAHIGMVERVLLAMIDDPEAFPDPQVVVREMMRLAFEGMRLPSTPSPFGE